MWSTEKSNRNIAMRTCHVLADYIMNKESGFANIEM